MGCGRVSGIGSQLAAFDSFGDNMRKETINKPDGRYIIFYSFAEDEPGCGSSKDVDRKDLSPITHNPSPDRSEDTD